MKICTKRYVKHYVKLFHTTYNQISVYYFVEQNICTTLEKFLILVVLYNLMYNSLKLVVIKICTTTSLRHYVKHYYSVILATN